MTLDSKRAKYLGKLSQAAAPMTPEHAKKLGQRSGVARKRQQHGKLLKCARCERFKLPHLFALIREENRRASWCSHCMADYRRDRSNRARVVMAMAAMTSEQIAELAKRAEAVVPPPVKR